MQLIGFCFYKCVAVKPQVTWDITPSAQFGRSPGSLERTMLQHTPTIFISPQDLMEIDKQRSLVILHTQAGLTIIVMKREAKKGSVHHYYRDNTFSKTQYVTI